MHLRVVCAALTVVTMSSAVRAQRPAAVHIPDEPSCVRCTITVTPVTRLGLDAGPGALNGRPMGLSVDSRGRFWVINEGEPPAVFGPRGAFLQLVGTRGAGPGEFGWPNDAIQLGDSMLVVDRNRVTVIGPDLKATRTIGFGEPTGRIVIISWPTNVFRNGFATASKPAGSILHHVDFAAPVARIVSSFGPVATGGVMGSAEVSQVVARAGGKRMWSSYWKRYSVTLWNADGTAVQSFDRSPPWFTGKDPGGIGTPTTPPSPSLTALYEDAAGLLWVFVSVPAPTWRLGWPKMAPGQREAAGRLFGFDKMFRTTVEVIDPKLNRVVARRTLDGYVSHVLPDGRAAMYSQGMNDIPRVSIVALAVVGR
jgi:hypothetical protein